MPAEENKNRRTSFMEIMKNRILSGELKPGDRLPPERELAEQLGFSRGSVNQGMLDLARMGFADRAAQRRVRGGICSAGHAGDAVSHHGV